jgi:hypothetical protein
LSRNVQRPESDDAPPGRDITSGNLYPILSILYAKNVSGRGLTLFLETNEEFD